ncbi:phospholipid-binding protein MlaC [Roseovarius sp. EL26]|uniref:MlaC/ttg2D family ABC transporter substrate-binding protein n=1 Tax=Roseovarius sp. EL26 TaxID=2126672 RepID=UPI000EA11368|nr:ABC transporter substrate-binding protein [Roseovarius sp. EL26]
MNSELSRRAVIGTAMAAAVASLPLPALALTDAQAEALVNKVVGEINKVIASGKSLNSMIKDFERIFSRYADVNIIARSALGPAAKTASKSQMRNFTKAFQGYIARKYGKRFNEFVGGRIEVKGTRKVKSWQEVKSLVYLRGSAPFNVNFLVSDRSGKDLFFDMVIEGISLRLTERTEIGSLLDKNKGNIDKMIADLKKAG